ncbi:hypothetical protein K502DRAFT_283930, partial [Neoconidiobolus thromboides FSU 785]
IMLEEGNKQQFTWMAYGATVRVWGKRGTFGANRLIARKDLMRIAANVARFEPVIMIVNDSKDKAEAKKFLDQVVLEPVSALSDSYEDGAIFTGGKSLPEIQLSNIKFVIQPVDDLWIRDTSAIFVTDSNQLLYGVNFNFNGWGQSDTGAKGWKEDKNKAANGIQYQPIENDQNIADFTISQTKAIKISTWLVMEGGGIEVDGKGTAICTESCIVNSNRNPGKTKADIELELERTLGVKKVLWLPGVKAKDITDGHIDFYARFSGNGHIIYALDNDPSSPDYKPTLLNKQILQNITDVSQNKLIPVPLNTPDLLLVRSAVTARNGWSRNSTNFNSDGFAASYAGFHAGEKYVLMSQYGDPNADLIAFKTLKDLFKGKSIIQITVDGISNGGGTIHCSTQE